MSNPSAPAAHRNVASIRSPGSNNTGAPASPHTPLRNISSAFGSPSALRAEEETVIFELGTRYLRAGFAGDAVPKAVINFGPEEQRRAGDYRRWGTNYDKSAAKGLQSKSWGEAWELWKLDLRDLDMGLVGDKLDRAVRDAFTKFLLIDSRPRRLSLAIPSTLPLPLLSTILDTLFNNFQPPTISLLSAPVLTTVAAGLRSALVVDIGWAETVVTAVYEYREVQCRRAVRGTKLLGEATYKVLAEAADLAEAMSKDKPADDKSEDDNKAHPSFEECEEIMARVLWCKAAKKDEPRRFDRGLTPVTEEDELRSSMRMMSISGQSDDDSTISIPLTSTEPPTTLKLQFADLAEPCDTALFATDTTETELDDEELPLHLLVYRSLLQLPVDVRSICMSRIVFVGGGSNILGLKGRVLDELAQLIDERSWDPVRGKAAEQYRNNPKLQRTKLRQNGPIEVLQQKDSNGILIIPAHIQKQEDDPIDEQLKREARKGLPDVESGNLRAVNSLGAWSGASLLSQMKVPAISIIDREQWLQHGAAGASKSTEIDLTNRRQSMGPGAAFKSGAGDRSSWTLGLWG
ncbi:actin-like ATPase domain-containing protein [Mollisia scopiformis]|uniref:Actin-like ATPase domain-containing protein n=1 Tax=Mollisia scopiformis TaxID=149040 RepID=A0A194X5P7_MOLSC|nr:actin-like ATPase domain-containing protein [Mollisia scopiformis]KUJ15501.1 actin-like ATPase domain-containing protein [Mollisia scopiformis]